MISFLTTLRSGGNAFFYSNAPDIPVVVGPFLCLRILSSVISEQRLHQSD